MARILAGRRRFFGHKRTIRPNAKKLVFCVSKSNKYELGDVFRESPQTSKGLYGRTKRGEAGRGEFHENPSTCICETSEAKAMIDAISKSNSNSDIALRTESTYSNRSEELSDGHSSDEEPDWADADDSEEESAERGSSNRTGSDDDLLTRSDEPRT